MGFRRNTGPRPRKIIFDQGELEGLWVRAHGVTVKEYVGLRTYTQHFELFADRFLEWNWADEDGNDLPPTRESLDLLDVADLKTIVDTWADMVTRSHRPLAQVATAATNGTDLDLESTIPTGPMLSDDSA